MRILAATLRDIGVSGPLAPEGSVYGMAAQDEAELEEAVVAHLAPAEALGRPFRALRALRPLLFAGARPSARTAALAERPQTWGAVNAGCTACTAR